MHAFWAPVWNHGLNESGMCLLVYFHLNWLKVVCSGIAQCEPKELPQGWTELRQLHQRSLAINKPSWKPPLEIYLTLLFHGRRGHLYGSCWLTFSQPCFPTSEWKESNILILTCFKDFVDFGLIVIKNILLCTVEDLHLICCKRQQLCDARWHHEIASKDWIIGVLLPSVWTEASVPSTHKPWNYQSRHSRFVFLSLYFFKEAPLWLGFHFFSCPSVSI